MLTWGVINFDSCFHKSDLDENIADVFQEIGLYPFEYMAGLPRSRQPTFLKLKILAAVHIRQVQGGNGPGLTEKAAPNIQKNLGMVV